MFFHIILINEWVELILSYKMKYFTIIQISMFSRNKKNIIYSYKTG